jgi:hypothetical protein
MKSRVLAVVLGALSTLTTVSARADPLDLRLGSWEVTFTTIVSGSLVPEAQLQQMPPAQRERVEAMLKKQRADGPKTRTTRTCLTRDDLDRAFQKGDEDEEKDCRRTTRVATKSRQEIAMVCTGEHPRKTEWRMEATSRESAKGEGKVTSESGSVTMSFAARWVASACGKDD